MPTNPPIFDGHNDVLLSLHLPERGKGRTFFERSSDGHLDLPRAREGGFGGGFFAMFVPNPPESIPAGQPEVEFTENGYEVPYANAIDPGYARDFTIALMARLFRLEENSAGNLKIVRDIQELEICLQNDILAAIMHFEGAEAIDPDLNALEVFYRAGLRSLGLVWSRPNAFAYGVPFRFPHTPDTGPGLTEAGKRLVKACNLMGIMLDLSHLNEQGFWDVADISSAPLVATHSNVFGITPSTRNLTDKQLAAIRDSDGMVGLNFGTTVIRPDGLNDPDTSLEMMLNQIESLIEQLGIDRVGFGSDFDGTLIPQEIGDAAGLPKLLDGLRARGYNEGELTKLANENWMRILRKTWQA